MYRDPRPSFHIRGLDAPFPYKLLLSHLGDKNTNFSLKSQGSIVSCSGSITSVGEERAIFSAIVVVSVQRGFLFLLVLVMDCVILL